MFMKKPELGVRESGSAESWSEGHLVEDLEADGMAEAGGGVQCLKS